MEKEKLNYNLKKQVFEQEIFFLREKYHTGLPTLSKMRRKCIMLQDLKNDLCNELKKTNALVYKESKANEKSKIQIPPSELEIRYGVFIVQYFLSIRVYLHTFIAHFSMLPHFILSVVFFDPCTSRAMCMLRLMVWLS